ncbi:MAG: hypothetical protein U0794_08680 [Isosphaeraceae bacterium]
MSLEAVRIAYPVLVSIAADLAQAVTDRKPPRWVSYDEFCARCKELGIKETPRTIAARILKPLQAACLENNVPDLSAVIIQKPRSRGDFGDLIRPSDGWWEIYEQRGEAKVGDVVFWFRRFQAARDYRDWPEAPFF